jgi:hypothetical protein
LLGLKAGASTISRARADQSRDRSTLGMPNLQHPGMDAISVSDDFTSARVGGSRKPSGQIRQRNQNARVICPNHLQQPESSDRNGTTSNLDKLLNHSPGFRMHSDFFTPSRLRFTDRDQNALKWFCRSIDFQRTANSVLTVCVSRGDNPRNKPR